MRKSKIKQITLAVCLTLLPVSVYAAGLGKINVSSGLGEPLQAEIELLSVSADELSSLVAAIASEDAYLAQGMTRAAIHRNIKVDLGKSALGAPVLKVRSSVPVDDPFLDMLIQVDWATGRLQREYTVLLDPPGYQANFANNSPTQINAPSISSNANTVKATNTGSNSPSKKIATVATPTKAPENPQTNSDVPEALTTRRGDTLSSIAARLQIDGVSLDQMLIALYENNPSAFSGKNINQLKVGQILRRPSAERLNAVSPAEATQRVRIHASNWADYRNSLAGVVASSPTTDSVAEDKQSVSGKIATAEDQAKIVKSGPQDVVKLSSGDKETARLAGNKGYEEKINALQEEATARDKALIEAQTRTNALEKQIQDMQKLLAMKNESLANVQQTAESSNTQTPTPDAGGLELAPSNNDVANQSNISPENNTQIVAQAEPASDAPSDLTTPADASVNMEKPAKKALPIPVQTPTIEQPTFIDSLLNAINPLFLALAAFLALLAGGWLYLRNKRKRDLDSFERGILTSGGIRANTVFGNTTSSTSNSDTSFLTDFAQSADGSMIDTNDVDPIAEAEVYMAYGRDAQAEEILKDAMTKEPMRYELHLKLLEMYAARQDNSAFEAIAGELYTTLGADNPTWAKVAEIGVVMEPNNPMYTAGLKSSNNLVATSQLAAADFSDVGIADGAALDFTSDLNEESDLKNEDELVVAESLTDASSDKSSGLDDLDFNFQQEVNPSNQAEIGGIAFTPSDVNDAEKVKTDTNQAMDFDLGDFSFEMPNSDETKVTEQALDNELNAGLSFVVTEDFNAVQTTNDEAPKSTTPDAFAETIDSFPSFEMPADAVENIDADEAVIGAEDTLSALPEVDRPLDLTFPQQESITPLEEMQVDNFDFNLDLAADDTPLSTENDVKMNDFNAISTDLDMVEIDTNTTTPQIQSADRDSIAAAAEAAAFDLSSISFDLDEPSTDHANDNNASAIDAFASAESEDVAIKLDLVNAYIEMDDKEGARELLEEVLREGGSLQQKRAQDLLASLN